MIEDNTESIWWDPDMIYYDDSGDSHLMSVFKDEDGQWCGVVEARSDDTTGNTMLIFCDEKGNVIKPEQDAYVILKHGINVIYTHIEDDDVIICVSTITDRHMVILNDGRIHTGIALFGNVYYDHVPIQYKEVFEKDGKNHPRLIMRAAVAVSVITQLMDSLQPLRDVMKIMDNEKNIGGK